MAMTGKEELSRHIRETLHFKKRTDEQSKTTVLPNFAKVPKSLQVVLKVNKISQYASTAGIVFVVIFGLIRELRRLG